MVGSLRGVAAETVQIGLPVMVDFEDVTPDLTLCFEPEVFLGDRGVFLGDRGR